MALRIPPATLPLIGGALGAAGGALMISMERNTGASIAVILWVAVTLAWSERGILRWFPKLPMFGSLIAAGTILIRWYALASLPPDRARVMIATLAAGALPAAAAIALAWISRPADDAAVALMLKVTTVDAVAAIVLALGAAVATGLQMGAALAIGCYFIVRFLKAGTDWRHGGVHGSDLAATVAVVQVFVLAMLGGFPAAW